MVVPIVAMGVHLQRLEHETAGEADRLIQKPQLCQALMEVSIGHQLQSGLARQQQRFRLNRQLDPQAKEAHHVHHARSGEVVAKLLEVDSNPGLIEALGPKQIQQRHIEVQARTSHSRVARSLCRNTRSTSTGAARNSTKVMATGETNARLKTACISTGGEPPRQERQRPRDTTRIHSCPRDHREDRGRGAVQHGCAEAADQPEDGQSTAERLQIHGVLNQGETGSNGETVNQGVDRESDPSSRDQARYEQGLERFLG